MALKVTGLIAVFFVCSAAGLLQTAKLAKRVRQLEALQNALSLISTEIRYFASPVSVIMRKISTLDEYKDLAFFGCCQKEFEKTKDFPKAWETAIRQTESSLALNQGDLETLLWFGNSLGTTDIEGQVANCERYSKLLSKRLEDAREEKQKKGKMYTSLGFLSGGLFFIILI